MVQYDKSQYYVDFSEKDNLTNDEKKSLEKIQEIYRPIERVNFIIDYVAAGKITNDEFEKMTGIPYGGYDI